MFSRGVNFPDTPGSRDGEDYQEFGAVDLTSGHLTIALRLSGRPPPQARHPPLLYLVMLKLQVETHLWVSIRALKADEIEEGCIAVGPLFQVPRNISVGVMESCGSFQGVTVELWLFNFKACKKVTSRVFHVLRRKHMPLCWAFLG